jgi:hypothetical protein
VSGGEDILRVSALLHVGRDIQADIDFDTGSHFHAFIQIELAS